MKLSEKEIMERFRKECYPNLIVDDLTFYNFYEDRLPIKQKNIFAAYDKNSERIYYFEADSKIQIYRVKDLGIPEDDENV